LNEEPDGEMISPSGAHVIAHSGTMMWHGDGSFKQALAMTPFRTGRSSARSPGL